MIKDVVRFYSCGASYAETFTLLWGEYPTKSYPMLDDAFHALARVLSHLGVFTP
jgi:hypothetical protein